MSQKCPKCSKSVYAAEWIPSGGLFYHKSCFKCALCSRDLAQGKQKDWEEKIYCDLCFSKNFSGIGSGAAVGKPGTTGAGEKCPVCNKNVYQAEEVKTQTFKYHPSCFVCNECKVRLTLGKQKEKEGNVYCDLCFNKKFSIIGSGTAVAQPGSVGVGDKCPVCNKAVYAAEEIKTEKYKYHAGCFVCNECKVHLRPGTQQEKEGNVYCTLCFNKKFSIIGSGTSVAQPGSVGVGDKCHVCDKAVFAAEEVKTERYKYHPTCFVCTECKSRLTLGKQKEKEGNVYCDLCFNKKFSIVGSGTSLARPGDVSLGEKCPVCFKAVFQAEQIRTEKLKYHPNCFVCNRCKTQLVLGKQREKDYRVFCENCYSLLFRTGGYSRQAPAVDKAEPVAETQAEAEAEAEQSAATEATESEPPAATEGEEGGE